MTTPSTSTPGALEDLAAGVATPVVDLLNAYAHVFLTAFLVTLLATPIVRRIAVRHGIIDRPDEKRKVHTEPIAYLGGAAVFLGLMCAIGVSYLGAGGDTVLPVMPSVPKGVWIGMIAITLTGLADDVLGWDPRTKIAGQLVAAAALALSDVGPRAAEGLLMPLLGEPSADLVLMGEGPYYWIGTALTALFVLGGCNSANLVDGLDGLLSGTMAITAMGLLAISLMMVMDLETRDPSLIDSSLGGARVILCAALLGAVLGFLPHNFNPASIFLGDAGSLLLGYMAAVIILMLGDRGQTHLVVAGLIVYSIPIMDTTLAIIRRKLSGKPMSAPDAQHIHHQMKRATGGVKSAVLALYGIAALFAATGVTLAALVIFSGLRVRAIYAIAIVLFGFIGVIAVKSARREAHQSAIAEAAKRSRKATGE